MNRQIKNSLLRLAAASLAAFVALTAAAGSTAPKRELRSTWVAGMNIDWPCKATSRGTTATAQANAKKELTDYLDKFQAQGLNSICIHARPQADANYKSSYEPWSADFSGTRGTSPGWDPLAFAVEECHKRGMECWAWVNPFRINKNCATATYSTTQDKEWVSKGWTIKNTAGTWLAFNPGLEAAREHCLKVIKEIYTNYDVDGLLFDDYFYPDGGMPENSSADDYEQYEDADTDMSIADWRRENVATFLQALYDDIQTTRPDVRFGIGPAGVSMESAADYNLPRPNVTTNDWMYGKIYCDPLRWLNDGTVDFVSPQIYWQRTHSTAPYEPLCKWWYNAAEKFGRHNFVSVAAYKLESDFGGNNSTGWSEISAQIDLTRKYSTTNAPGVVYYNTKSVNGPLMSGLGDYIAANNFGRRSLIPPMSWKEHPVYAAPADVKRSGTTLSWTAATKATDRAIIRYSVYAVPDDKSLDEAADAGGDGISNEYLQGVSYSTSFTLPSSVAGSGYWYAVCVYDGYGYESEPGLYNYNYSTVPSEAVTLLSPADGAELADSETFSWSAVKGGSYTLQIAGDASFALPVASCSVGSSTEYTVDLTKVSLGSKAKAYWRVISKQDGCLATASDSRSFVAPERQTGAYEDGYVIVADPAEYTGQSDLTLTPLWTRAGIAPYENMSFESNGSLSRYIVADDSYVYLTARASAASTAAASLVKYDAKTGEKVGTLALGSAASVAFYPCNTVMKDSKGNILIANLTTNSYSTPVIIHKVNTETGAVTQVAALTFSTSSTSGGGRPGGGPGGWGGQTTYTGYRIDHVAVYGDIDGTCHVFAATANNPYLLRWTITNGTASEPTARTISSFYPSAAHFSIAPHVYPVSDNLVYVDGSSTGPCLYNFSTGALVGSMGNASDSSARPDTYNDNGVCEFTLDNSRYLVYSSSVSELGAKWKISSFSANTLGDMKKLWEVPADGLGTVSSGSLSAPVCTVAQPDGSVNVYCYSAGNGLAAYRVAKKDNSTGIGIIGDEAVTDAPVEYYNLQGVRVNNPSSGVYIRRQGATATKVLVK